MQQGGGTRDERIAQPPRISPTRRVRFGSIADLVSTERACAWTLGGLLDDAQFVRLLAQAQPALRPFVHPAGQVVFEMPVLVITAVRR